MAMAMAHAQRRNISNRTKNKIAGRRQFYQPTRLWTVSQPDCHSAWNAIVTMLIEQLRRDAVEMEAYAVLKLP